MLTLKLDRLNLLEKQLMLPAIKHKWVSRLIENKRLKNQLENKKKISRQNFESDKSYEDSVQHRQVRPRPLFLIEVDDDDEVAGQ